MIKWFLRMATMESRLPEFRSSPRMMRTHTKCSSHLTVRAIRTQRANVVRLINRDGLLEAELTFKVGDSTADIAATAFLFNMGGTIAVEVVCLSKEPFPMTSKTLL